MRAQKADEKTVPKTRTRILTEDGVALLEYRVEAPALPAECGGFQKIAAFYAGITDQTVSYLEKTLAPALAEEYRASPDPRRRFTYRRILYRMLMQTAEENGILVVLRSVTVLRAGRTLFEERMNDRWLLAGGQYLPAKKEKRPRKSKKSRKTPK